MGRKLAGILYFGVIHGLDGLFEQKTNEIYR